MRRQLLCAMIALSSGCTAVMRPNEPWRTVDSERGETARPADMCTAIPPPPPGQPAPAIDLTFADLGRRDVQNRAACYAHENFPANGVHDGFSLHAIEFDDQGR